MFWTNLLKRNNTRIAADNDHVYSPVDGRQIPLETVGDQVFASHMMGDGVGIRPRGDRLYAPVNGTIRTVFPTGHAIGIEADNGGEIILHIGIETVMLQGKGFHCRVREGQHVKAGELLMELDRREIEQAGYDLTTMVILSNVDQFHVRLMEQENVSVGTPLFEMEKVSK